MVAPSNAPAAAPAVPSVADVMAPIHDRWLRLVRERLTPLLAPDADRWARWPAVRFLRDQWEHWRCDEQRLVHAVAPYLHPADLRRLAESDAALEAQRRHLDEVGCRLRNGVVADAARRFLARLELRRTEVAAALAMVAADRMTDESRRLLRRLEALAELGS